MGYCWQEGKKLSSLMGSPVSSASCSYVTPCRNAFEMSAVQMGQWLRTASEARSFCAHLELVPVYRSMSFLSLSLKPRTVRRARISRVGCKASDDGLPPAADTSTVGVTHLNFITQRTSMMLRALRRSLRLKHLRLDHVCNSLSIPSALEANVA